MNLEKIDSYCQLEVGDLVFDKLTYDDFCTVKLFLGFYLKNSKIDNMLQKEFQNVSFTVDELENFELAKNNHVELSYYCSPYFYTLAQILVQKDNDIPLDKTIVNPKGTFAYIKNMIEFMRDGNGLDTQLHYAYSSNNNIIYRMKGVVDKEFIKNYILKLKFMGYLPGAVSILSLEDINNILKKAFLARKKAFLLEKNKLKNVLENPVVREIVQYGIYCTKTKKDGTRKYFACIGHSKDDNAPLFISLPLEDKNEWQILDWVTRQSSMWLGNVVRGTGRRISTLKGKELYDTSIRLSEPNFTNITEQRFNTLRTLITEDIRR